jgi:hypothetical protein
MDNAGVMAIDRVVVIAVRTMTPTTRALGIEFGELRDEFEQLPCPITNADL